MMPRAVPNSRLLWIIAQALIDVLKPENAETTAPQPFPEFCKFCLTNPAGLDGFTDDNFLE
jgi:hypothetical protein